MYVKKELATLQAADLIRQLEELQPAYSFKHILTQETTYATLLLQDRRKLHLTIACSLEQLYPEAVEANLSLLAHHYALAGDKPHAIGYLRRYGEQAFQISAFPEAIRAFERALELLPETPSAERAQASARLGDVYYRCGDLSRARENFRVALAVAIEAQDAKTAAAALTGVALIESQEGNHARARDLGIEALRWALDANDKQAIGLAHRQLGIAFNYEGDNTAAEEHLRSALALFEELDDREGIASSLNSLGIVARDQGDLPRALDYIQRALALSEELGDRYSISIRLGNLADLAEQQGDLEAAERYQNQALTIAQEIGDRHGVALGMLNLGSLELKRGKPASAMDYYRRAFEEAFGMGGVALALYVVAAIAKLEFEQGNYPTGAELLSMAYANPAAAADLRQDFAELWNDLQRVLDAAEWDAAVAQGQALDLNTLRARFQVGEDIRFEA